MCLAASENKKCRFQYQNGAGAELISASLTEAYQLESTAAIFPRILIHQSIIDKLRNHHQTGKTYLKEIVEAGLLQQDGKITQLHVLDEGNWNVVYSGSRAIYQKDKAIVDDDSQLRLKHMWLQNYLFSFRPKGCRKCRYISEFTPFST